MIFRSVKALILWRYARNTWQYDVLCLLILAFIFLTPQSWFGQSKLERERAHRRSGSLVVLPAEPAPEGRESIEKRIRALPGMAETEVTGIRPVPGESGEVVAYEVDIGRSAQ